MSAANVCAHRGIPKDEARTLIAEQLTRPPNPTHEIEDAITKAYNEVGTRFKRSAAPIRFGLSAQDSKRITRAQERMSWPPLAALSNTKTNAIAESLGISPESVEIASNRGLFLTAPCGGLVVTDSSSRKCALRLSPERSFLPGSERGWPVGLKEDDASGAVALVAGVRGLLSAIHLTWCAGLTGVVTPAAVFKVPPI
jgi:hypothetical protein